MSGTLGIKGRAMIRLLSALGAMAFVRAADEFVPVTDRFGVTHELPVNRYPALYTGDFGDCLGESLFNITKFDAAYYADNSTVVFHLDGTTNVRGEYLMMQLSIKAYGKPLYELAFDPCAHGMPGLCPLNAGAPFEAWAAFPADAAQINMSSMALSWPDVEGSAKLQIFANSSQTEIGCFQAALRNRRTLSHAEIVCPVLGAFTAVAVAGSFLTAAYGVSLTHMRMHYAHSLPVLLVFETFQTVFFSGALTADWPSMLVAWWSNFGWSAGLIYSSSMIGSIKAVSGVRGNASQVGGAGPVVINPAGGLTTRIYGRSLLTPRHTYNASDPFDYEWAGNPVAPGMPLPGMWRGFPATLSVMGIPPAEAFLVGLVWLLVALGMVAVFVVGLKLTLEALAGCKVVKEDRLVTFRSRWIRFLALAWQRTLFMAFFMVMTLSLYEFALRGSPVPTAVAAVVFALMLAGLGLAVAVALRTRTKLGTFHVKADEIIFHQTKIFNVSFIAATRQSVLSEREQQVKAIAGVPMFRIQHINDKPNGIPTVHRDDVFLQRFGWLSARYRLSKWWFFSYYLCYQFVRAAFLGGAVNNPLAQVYGLLILEVAAFLIVVFLRPFEGARNTALAVWMIGLVKILTTGLSVPLLPGSGTDRMTATVIGLVIIVIQGLLVLALLVLIVVGTITTWLSLSRNREDFEPECLDGMRICYFEKMEKRASDRWVIPGVSKKAMGKQKEEALDFNSSSSEAIKDETTEKTQAPRPRATSFTVNSVRRTPKIEDEDDDEDEDRIAELDPAASGPSPGRADSTRSAYSAGNLPRAAARPHRATWSSRDSVQWADERPESALSQRVDAWNGTSPSSPSPGPARARGSRGSPPQRRYRSATTSSPTFVASPLDSRSSTPIAGFRAGTPSRETLARHAEERVFRTPQPPTDVH